MVGSMMDFGRFYVDFFIGWMSDYGCMEFEFWLY